MVSTEAECKLPIVAALTKAQRAYRAAFRDGLRIIWKLRQGETDHLLKSTGFELLHYSFGVHLKQLDSSFLTIQAIEGMNDALAIHKRNS